MNNIFENNYTTVIEPIYGIKRDNIYDIQLTQNIHAEHQFKIKERVDFTNIDVYSIDPDGCVDADDAFSIYETDNKLYLAIHIADPTDFIDINSKLWEDINNRTTTKYLSNRKPINMMPDEVLELSSLMENTKGNIKNAITILTEINKTNYNPINNIKILFTKIKVHYNNAFTYKNVSRLDIPPIKIGLLIAHALKQLRSKKTKGVKLNELSMAYPVYTDNDIYLYVDTQQEKYIKQMIAEFAIFANSYVGEYLTINLNMGIFRTCQANEWLQNLYSNITPEDMIKEIITNGIKADYLSKVESHDLVGMPEYCHFTSPIRRLADCICHYLLKYVYLKKQINCPFNNTTLMVLADKCVRVTKMDKKNQYLDIKYRLLQVMNSMVERKSKVNIEYYITSYTGLFVNLIICKIDEYNVHISYTIRVLNYQKDINSKYKNSINITKINCFIKYDEGTIPELDKKILE
jgi:exoribonuclease R